MSIFRAYDIRGIVGEDLTVEIVHQLGKAIGSEAQTRQQTQIAVGRDGRLSGAELSQALIKGILSTGCDVIDVGCVPTPVLYFASYHLKTYSGVMVTGSHNPVNYNGFKIVLAKQTLAGEAIQALAERIETQNFVTGTGQLSQQDVQAAYKAQIVDDSQIKRRLHAVVDCGNGVAGKLAPQLLTELGCQVTPLYCEIDGNFPNHHPDPSVPANLVDLQKTVIEQNADIGLAFDGDGDRLGVVDNKGSIIWADRQMMLYARDILQRNQGAHCIYDVKCSRHLASEIQQAGGVPVMWKTGHSFMKAKLQSDDKALLAGEMSGHIFFKERWYGFDDGLYTAARLIEILSQQQDSAAEIFARLPNAVNTPELKLELQAYGEQFTLMDKIHASFSFPEAECYTLDGLRVEFANGWGLVRPSNTTPCLVLRFEADNDNALHTIQEQFRQQFLALDNNLTLPF